jgi:hypothetical protein
VKLFPGSDRNRWELSDGHFHSAWSEQARQQHHHVSFIFRIDSRRQYSNASLIAQSDQEPYRSLVMLTCFIVVVNDLASELILRGGFQALNNHILKYRINDHHETDGKKERKTPAAAPSSPSNRRPCNAMQATHIILSQIYNPNSTQMHSHKPNQSPNPPPHQPTKSSLTTPLLLQQSYSTHLTLFLLPPPLTNLPGLTT